MRKFWIVLVVQIIALVLLGLAGCVTMATTSQDSFNQIVKATMDKWKTAALAGDAEALIDLWDDNGINLVPGRPIVTGKAAIAERVKTSLAAIKYETMDIIVLGTYVDHNLGFCWMNIKYSITPRAEGKTIIGDVKDQSIFKRQPDGSWKVISDMNNSNIP